jgi:hypothetical protein
MGTMSSLTLMKLMRFRHTIYLDKRASQFSFYHLMPSRTMCMYCCTILDIPQMDGPDISPADSGAPVSRLNLTHFPRNVPLPYRLGCMLLSASKPCRYLCADLCAVSSVLEPRDRRRRLLVRSPVYFSLPVLPCCCIAWCSGVDIACTGDHHMVKVCYGVCFIAVQIIYYTVPDGTRARTVRLRCAKDGWRPLHIHLGRDPFSSQNKCRSAISSRVT